MTVRQFDAAAAFADILYNPGDAVHAVGLLKIQEAVDISPPDYPPIPRTTPARRQSHVRAVELSPRNGAVPGLAYPTNMPARALFPLSSPNRIHFGD